MRGGLMRLYRWLCPVSRTRRESNVWLKRHCADVTGAVLSIGSGSDQDGEGATYREYFKKAAAYTTSELSADYGCDLVLDVQSMPEVKSCSFDAVFCSGVLEHVPRPRAALREIARVLKPGGALLLGLPFRQPLHMPPNDYWRFTEYGIRELLSEGFQISVLDSMDAGDAKFPAAYWCKAVKK